MKKPPCMICAARTAQAELTLAGETLPDHETQVLLGLAAISSHGLGKVAGALCPAHAPMLAGALALLTASPQGLDLAKIRETVGRLAEQTLRGKR